MNWWYVTYLILVALGVGIGMVQHGKEKIGKHSFWNDIIAVIISVVVVTFAVLHGGL